MAPTQPDPEHEAVEADLVLTFEEAAARLKVKESWLRTQVAARQVPHARLGRRIRFSEEHLSQIVAAATETPIRPQRRLGRAS